MGNKYLFLSSNHYVMEQTLWNDQRVISGEYRNVITCGLPTMDIAD
jgi:hypothetical protein